MLNIARLDRQVLLEKSNEDAHKRISEMLEFMFKEALKARENREAINKIEADIKDLDSKLRIVVDYLNKKRKAKK